MRLNFLLLSTLCSGVSICWGSVEFIQVPDSLKLTSFYDQLSLSQLPDVISQAMGFTTPEVVEWTPLQPKSLFRRPKANLMFVDHKHQQQIDDTDLNDMSFHRRLKDAYTNTAQPLIVVLNPSGKVTSSDDIIPNEALSSFPDTYLETLDTVERHLIEYLPSLLSELSWVIQLSEQIMSQKTAIEDSASDSFVFHLKALGRVAGKHGELSEKYKAASKLTDHVLKQVCSELSKAYKSELLCERVSAEAAPSWSGRKLLQASATASMRPSNQAAVYDALFPVTFNIVLGLSIFVILAVILVSHSLWYMDPGRDSIIYRMTTQRLKKD